MEDRRLPNDALVEDVVRPKMPLLRGGNSVLFIGQCQGRLYCVVREGSGELFKQPYQCLLGETAVDAYGVRWREHGLSIWALQELDTEECVLKGRVSYLELFGESSSRYGFFHCRVAAMHPDCNLVFLCQYWDGQMISYGTDRQEVRVLDTDIQNYCSKITPYVSYLSELFLGVIGGHKVAH